MNLLNAFNISRMGTRVGALVYGQNVHNGFSLNQYVSQQAIKRKIAGIKNAIPLGSSMTLKQALSLVESRFFIRAHLEETSNEQPKTLVIFLIDQIQEDVSNEMRNLKHFDVVVVGLGSQVTDTDLVKITANTKNHHKTDGNERIDPAIIIDFLREGLYVVFRQRKNHEPRSVFESI